MTNQALPVAIIGAGPVGLAAAAHLLERGETPIIFEAGAEIGANIRQWEHVRMFSPWEYTADRATVALLESHGWEMPPKDTSPTGRDLIEKYMQPFAQLPEVRQHIHLNSRVTAISRRYIDKMKDTNRESAPFVIRVQCDDGSEEIIEARAVIDASGTWHSPNPLGSDGLPAMGESSHQAHIYYGIPDVQGKYQQRYANKRVMVVGGGHSAINALLDLVNLQDSYPKTCVTWVLRTTNMQRIYGGGSDDALPARGQLGIRIRTLVEAGRVSIAAPFRIRKISTDETGVTVTGETPQGFETLQVDEIVAATGARPDLIMLRELRLALDSSLETTPLLAPMIDPNIHSCGTVRPHGEAELRHPEKDFYIVGMKSYGRAPTFLLATGYEQVRSIVAALVGDWEAARDVQLNLPETGVCVTDWLSDEISSVAASACCGTPSENVATPVAVQEVVSLNAISLSSTKPQPVDSQTSSRDCGCDDTCCT
ncbi:MAG: NAD(P)-binding domain-containing protein [Anaerolineae bacterium]|nr:NAD(P)-binding domain-containing protein [Anaerolineae bacterium]